MNEDIAEHLRENMPEKRSEKGTYLQSQREGANGSLLSNKLLREVSDGRKRNETTTRRMN